MHKEQKNKSLLWRLLWRCIAIFVAMWLVLLGSEFFSAKKNGSTILEKEFSSDAKRLLIVLRPLANNPEKIPEVIKNLQNLEDDKGHGGYGSSNFKIQVWRANHLVYSDTDIPSDFPDVERNKLIQLSPDSHFFGLSQSDEKSDFTVRLAIDNSNYYWINESAIGFYFLPLIISLPFLVIPIWFVVKRGLKPLNETGNRIATRSASDLSPLPLSDYKELSIIEVEINQMMYRLASHIEREQAFLADAAHELKTPLAIIQVNTEALVSTNDSQRRAEAAEDLIQGVRRAAHSVNQLLNMMRTQSDITSNRVLLVTELAQLVRQRMAEIEPVAHAKQIELSFDAKDVPYLKADSLSLSLLIDNLLDNAIKYSPTGATVEVHVYSASQSVVLTVTDKGSGIPISLRNKVFERFFRVPGQDVSGSGLGLAIVQKIALQHHARVSLNDNPSGQGLQVMVEFYELASV